MEEVRYAPIVAALEAGPHQAVAVAQFDFHAFAGESRARVGEQVSPNGLGVTSPGPERSDAGI
jgi:hypothetical protein